MKLDMAGERQPDMVPSINNQQVLLVSFLSLLIFTVTLFLTLPTRVTGGEHPATLLDRNPVYSASAGKSVAVNVTFASPQEITEIRLYFKTMATDHYFFLPMTESGKGNFVASLPPAKNWTKGMDYLLLLKNIQGETRKTKPFRLLIQNDYNSVPQSPNPIMVQTEHPTNQTENLDFAVPLRVIMTTEPLLEHAVEDPYPPVSVPGPGGGRGSSGMFDGLGGVSFSIKIGGVGLSFH